MSIGIGFIVLKIKTFLVIDVNCLFFIIFSLVTRSRTWLISSMKWIRSAQMSSILHAKRSSTCTTTNAAISISKTSRYFTSKHAWNNAFGEDIFLEILIVFFCAFSNRSWILLDLVNYCYSRQFVWFSATISRMHRKLFAKSLIQLGMLCSYNSSIIRKETPPHHKIPFFIMETDTFTLFVVDIQQIKLILWQTFFESHE